MKKYLIILLLVLLNVIVYTNKTKIASKELINLDLSKNEFALTIFSLENSKSILINKSELLVLEYIDSLNLENRLKLYGIEVLNNVIFKNEQIINIKSYNKQLLKRKIKIDEAEITKNENIDIIKYHDYSFCVYKSGNNKNLNNCDFIYFLDIDEIDFSDDVLAVFFDSDIDKNKIELYYDKWVDSYILNAKTIYTLKLLPNDYRVLEATIK